MPVTQSPIYLRDYELSCRRRSKPQQLHFRAIVAIAANMGKSVPREGEVDQTTDEKQWYALQLWPRYEKQVALQLRGKGYDEYLPLYRSRRRWSDRIKEIELPLFPGYIFCKFDVMKRLPILIVPGVTSVVGVGKVPLAIAEDEIAAVQRIVNSGLSYGPWAPLVTGQRVSVKYGPLRGLEGVVQEVRNTLQLVITVTILSRSVCVTIDRDSIVPIQEKTKVNRPAALAVRL
jgi:transcription antitermination factor NusG